MQETGSLETAHITILPFHAPERGEMTSVPLVPRPLHGNDERYPGLIQIAEFSGSLSDVHPYWNPRTTNHLQGVTPWNEAYEMNPGNLLEQFLGSDTTGGRGRAAGVARDKVNSHGVGGFAGGMAAGGLLGVLLGNKKARKMAGGVAGYGAAAAVGALAFKAYQNWQGGKAATSAPVATKAEMTAAAPEAFQIDHAPAADGASFSLTLIKAMIGAAKADGHVDATEQALIFGHVEKMNLDAEGKAFVFDSLGKPVDIGEIAASASTQEQAAEIYLVSRLAIDPDHPAERVYLDALAHKLSLPPDLVAHLNRQVEAGADG